MLSLDSEVEFRPIWRFDRSERQPLTPELLRKRQAIIRHQSQKDQPLFPGDDTREFWQRAEERCRRTAATFQRLGLPHYPALETFAVWDGRTMPA